METKSKSVRKDRYGNELANVSVRIPRQEYDSWNGAAARAGITLTALLRQAVKALIDSVSM